MKKLMFFRQKKHVKNPLVIFDVPYNRFDEVFKNCGFGVAAETRAGAGGPDCFAIGSQRRRVTQGAE